MADHKQDNEPVNHDAQIYRPRVAIGLLVATAAVSVVAVVVNLGEDALSAIAATVGVASALTLIAFASRSGKD
ncbi:hypothetical protein AB0C12_01370 [Actinoplanes sp. NPDC048967]|uniref:hypothetical protein n=1 Tax=Actinoplanes sp. NPDC048967 TaxID=3155269 RepID=UPI0033E1F140